MSVIFAGDPAAVRNSEVSARRELTVLPTTLPKLIVTELNVRETIGSLRYHDGDLDVT